MFTRVLTSGFFICALFSCSQPTDNLKRATVSTGQVMEFAPIHLKDSVSEEMLLKISSRLQNEFLSHQEGFVRRELHKKSDGEYVDLVYWDSQASADKALQNAMNSSICFHFFQLMKEADPEHPEEGLSYYQLVGEY